MPVTIDNPSSVIRVRQNIVASSADSVANRFCFVADQPYQVQQVNGIYSVTGSTTINIGKVFVASAGIAIGSAVPILTAAMNYAGGSAYLPLTGTVQASTTLSQLAVGDALAFIWGTASNMTPFGMIEIVLQRI